MEKGRIVIIAGGTESIFTTDSAAALNKRTWFKKYY